nr:MAG TPA: minor structural protein [Caudoviricetes sp.]
MSITVKYLEGLGIEKTVAEQIFAERSKEIEADKVKREKLENELSENKISFENLNAEFEKLKTENADGAEWKSRFEALQAETEAKAKQAEADRILAEKNTRNHEYFDNALKAIGKTSDDWNGKFTADGYYNEFVKAIESEENAGKAHKDILHDLVKNDQNAFKGVTAVKLAGGTPRGNSRFNSREEIIAIKDGATRRAEMLNNPQYFPEING